MASDPDAGRVSSTSSSAVVAQNENLTILSGADDDGALKVNFICAGDDAPPPPRVNDHTSGSLVAVSAPAASTAARSFTGNSRDVGVKAAVDAAALRRGATLAQCVPAQFPGSSPSALVVDVRSGGTGHHGSDMKYAPRITGSPPSWS